MSKEESRRVPDWLKGAGLGGLTYVVPLVLFQALVFTDSLWNWLDLDETWEALLYALLLAAIGNLEIANVPATVMYVFPVAWALLGAIFSRILGFRWGCLILLVLRVIATVVCGVFLLFLIGILVNL